MSGLFQPMWVMDEETSTMTQRELTYVPGLYKIFDEILGKLDRKHASIQGNYGGEVTRSHM